MQALIDRVLAQDYTVTRAVREAGLAAEPSLAPLASNPDEGVRELALFCLAETGGTLALDAFVRALLDADPLVRAAAMRSLLRHTASLTSAVAVTLLDTYDRSDEPTVRQAIALALGKSSVAGPALVAGLKERWANETAPVAEDGCVVALARLADADAKKVFTERLRQSSGRDRARLLEGAFYIGAPWLTKPLRPFLDDETPALRVGVDGVASIPEFLRVADLAVVLIATVSGRSFSFPVDQQSNFSEAQLDEVRAYVERLP